MSLLFPLGIQHLNQPGASMQAPGFYWINADQKADAALFCQQIITALPATAAAALICSGSEPDELLTGIKDSALQKLPLFTLPEKKAAITHLTADLSRALTPRNRLFILLANVKLWQTFSNEEFSHWVQQTSHWLKKQAGTLLILSHGQDAKKLQNYLVSLHPFLQGLANLQSQQDNTFYNISWWAVENGVIANQTLTLQQNPQGWVIASDSDPQILPLSRSDEFLFLAEKSVLQGTPLLSQNWQLLDNNTLLAQHGEHALAATLIFALPKGGENEINLLADHIHYLRRQRGRALKIVVREMVHGRYYEERLLLACGANLVVPHTASLSQFLTMVEGIQGQQFTRPVPANIDELLTAMRPLQLKGYLAPKYFFQDVLAMVSNTLLPENGKGVLIALHPAPGLQPEQVIPLCNLQRFGDIVTVIEEQVFLFLATCRISDVDTVLSYIFRLPVNEMFSKQVVWHEDLQMIAEIKRLSSSGNLLEKTMALPQSMKKVSDFAPSNHSRYSPTELTLTLNAKEGNI